MSLRSSASHRRDEFGSARDIEHVYPTTARARARARASESGKLWISSPRQLAPVAALIKPNAVSYPKRRMRRSQTETSAIDPLAFPPASPRRDEIPLRVDLILLSATKSGRHVALEVEERGREGGGGMWRERRRPLVFCAGGGQSRWLPRIRCVLRNSPAKRARAPPRPPPAAVSTPPS